MPQRKANSPWGSAYKEGLPTTSVNDSIDVDQMIRPMVDCGVISRESGQWEGVTTTDPQFIGITKAEGVANGAAVLFPDTDAYPTISMAGFTTLQFALKVTNGGNYACKAVFGPDTLPYAGLSPVQPNEKIRIIDSTGSSDESIFDDTIAVNYANSWFIVTVLADRCKGQDNLQVSVTNNSGGTADIEFAFRRLV